MMTTVAGDENAIGYISLGSLDDTVKAVKIEDVYKRQGQWLLAAVDRLRADWAAHPDDHPAQVSVQSAVRNPY